VLQVTNETDEKRRKATGAMEPLAHRGISGESKEKLCDQGIQGAKVDTWCCQVTNGNRTGNDAKLLVQRSNCATIGNLKVIPG